MAVRIDCMSIPKCCCYCPISKFSPATHVLFCGITNEIIKDDLIKLKSCPLKEIKE